MDAGEGKHFRPCIRRATGKANGAKELHIIDIIANETDISERNAEFGADLIGPGFFDELRQMASAASSLVWQSGFTLLPTPK